MRCGTGGSWESCGAPTRPCFDIVGSLHIPIIGTATRAAYLALVAVALAALARPVLDVVIDPSSVGWMTRHPLALLVGWVAADWVHIRTDSAFGS